MKGQILIVEDQATTSNLIFEVLTGEGFEVQAVDSLQKARNSVARGLPEVVILDRNLPDGDGLDFCKELRSDTKSAALPVIILTAQKAMAEKLSGLRGGADDYLAKPFNTEELVARVEILLRRSGKLPEPASQTAGDLRLDRDSRKTFVKNKEVLLSGKEFDLLWFLMHRRNHVISREFLLQHVWGYEHGLNLSTKVVDVTLSHLRDKIGQTAEMIISVRGFGYRFEG